MERWENKQLEDKKAMQEASRLYRPAPKITEPKSSGFNLNLLNPFYGIDAVVGAWNRATYDTPIGDIPIFGLKSSLNPLGKQYRKAYSLGEYAEKPPEGFFVKFTPMAPGAGPPLPQGLSKKWPWKD